MEIRGSILVSSTGVGGNGDLFLNGRGGMVGTPGVPALTD